MSPSIQEIETKFYVAALPETERRLQMIAGHPVQPRTQEVNFRFDVPHRDFQRSGRVLRLRRDEKIWLTYKGADQNLAGTRSRNEVEFAVSDFDSAYKFLEALGYQVVFIYEKFRTTYKRLDALIMLDELPYGNFVEIEGNLDDIGVVALELELNWDSAIPLSYHSLFQHLASARGLQFRDLTFQNFANIQVCPADLGVRPADVR